MRSRTREPGSWSEGDRVEVSIDYHWARGAAGMVATAPDEVVVIEPTFEGAERTVNSPTGMSVFLWIQFDEPQIDADGDGPYAAAEIDVRFLRRKS